MTNPGPTNPFTGTGLPLLPEGYRFEAICGLGGFGFLVLARQVETGRECVLKLPHAAMLLNPSLLRRFRHEIALHSRLEIPGVVRVVSRCVDGPAPFLGLDHYPLGSLAGWMEARNAPVPVTEVLHFGCRMAHALAEVHSLGIIHRDIRPENLLVSQAFPLEADLSDFGMAVSADDSSGLTRLIECDGFLAPEVTGEIQHPASPASDVWSAGMILAYLAWGPGRYVEALKPRCASPDGSTEARHLLACIRRCTAPWPADRYESGKFLLEDLKRVAAGKSPSNADAWTLAVARKRLTRRAVLAVAVAGSGFASLRWWLSPAQPPRQLVDTGPWAAAKQLVTLARSGEREQADRLWQLHGGLIAAHHFLGPRVEKALRPTMEILGWPSEILPEIYHAAFARDGSMLAAACQDGTVRVWSWPGRMPLFRTESVGHEINMVFFDGNGDFIWSVADDGRARVHDIRKAGATVGATQVAPLPLPCACVVGDILFAGDTHGGVHRVAPGSATVTWSSRPGTGRVESIAANADGTLLAAGMEDGGVYIMNVGDGTVRGRFRTVPDLRWIDWFEGDILIAGPDNKVLRLHGGDYHEMWSWPGGPGQPRSVVPTRLPGMESFILAAEDKGMAAMLDPSSGLPWRIYHGGPELVRHACPSPDGKSIIAVGRHGNPAVFNATRGQEFRTWSHREAPWVDAAWEGNATVAAIDAGGGVWRLDGNSLEAGEAVRKPAAEAEVVGFVPGVFVAWKSGDDVLLTSAKGQSVARLRVGQLGGLHLDREFFATAVAGGIAFAMAADGFASFRLIPINQDRVEAIHLARDADTLAVVCEDTMILLRLPDMVEISRLPRGDSFRSLCATRIAPGRIALGMRNGTVLIHDWKSGKVDSKFYVPSFAVTAIAADTTAGVLLTASANGVVCSHGMATHEAGPEWPMPTAQKVSKLEICPDGRQFLAVSSNGMRSMVSIWD